MNDDILRENMTFEEAKSQIEEIIRKLEGGNLPLEESITQFEKASQLIKYCQDKLDGYHKKIETVNIDRNIPNGADNNE